MTKWISAFFICLIISSITINFWVFPTIDSKAAEISENNSYQTISFFSDEDISKGSDWTKALVTKIANILTGIAFITTILVSIHEYNQSFSREIVKFNMYALATWMSSLAVVSAVVA